MQVASHPGMWYSVGELNRDKPTGAGDTSPDNRETGERPVRTRHCMRCSSSWEQKAAPVREEGSGRWTLQSLGNREGARRRSRKPGDLPAGVQTGYASSISSVKPRVTGCICGQTRKDPAVGFFVYERRCFFESSGFLISVPPGVRNGAPSGIRNGAHSGARKRAPSGAGKGAPSGAGKGVCLQMSNPPLFVRSLDSS